MPIDEEEIKILREELSSSYNPLFFFDDDADGLSSFIMAYDTSSEGHGVIIKTTPRIDAKFLPKVFEYSPDKVIILDIAEVEQDFIDAAKTKIIWVDHHQPQQRSNVLYFNPLKNSSVTCPTSYIIYQATKKKIWLAMAGCVGDWHIPDFKDEFVSKYPDLFEGNPTKPDAALFTTRIGKLAKIISFVLKGTTKDAMTCVKIMTRINEPYEIFEQSTSQGKYLWRRFTKTEERYNQLLSEVKPGKGNVVEHIYSGDNMSFTSDLSNELLFLHPNKVILVGRDRNDEIKMSLRSKSLDILGAAEKSLMGLEGFVGGHHQACGGMVKKKDYKKFLANLELNIK
ncbi:MAG: DHH family phosphoesterase [archaeon]